MTQFNEGFSFEKNVHGVDMLQRSNDHSICSHVEESQCDITKAKIPLSASPEASLDMYMHSMYMKSRKPLCSVNFQSAEDTVSELSTTVPKDYSFLSSDGEHLYSRAECAFLTVQELALKNNDTANLFLSIFNDIEPWEAFKFPIPAHSLSEIPAATVSNIGGGGALDTPHSYVSSVGASTNCLLMGDEMCSGIVGLLPQWTLAESENKGDEKSTFSESIQLKIDDLFKNVLNDLEGSQCSRVLSEHMDSTGEKCKTDEIKNDDENDDLHHIQIMRKLSDFTADASFISMQDSSIEIPKNSDKFRLVDSPPNVTVTKMLSVKQYSPTPSSRRTFMYEQSAPISSEENASNICSSLNSKKEHLRKNSKLELCDLDSHSKSESEKMLNVTDPLPQLDSFIILNSLYDETTGNMQLDNNHCSFSSKSSGTPCRPKSNAFLTNETLNDPKMKLNQSLYSKKYKKNGNPVRNKLVCQPENESQPEAPMSPLRPDFQIQWGIFSQNGNLHHTKKPSTRAEYFSEVIYPQSNFLTTNSNQINTINPANRVSSKKKRTKLNHNQTNHRGENTDTMASYISDNLLDTSTKPSDSLNISAPSYPLSSHHSQRRIRNKNPDLLISTENTSNVGKLKATVKLDENGSHLYNEEYTHVDSENRNIPQIQSPQRPQTSPCFTTSTGLNENFCDRNTGDSTISNYNKQQFFHQKGRVFRPSNFNINNKDENKDQGIRKHSPNKAIYFSMNHTSPKIKCIRVVANSVSSPNVKAKQLPKIVSNKANVSNIMNLNKFAPYTAANAYSSSSPVSNFGFPNITMPPKTYNSSAAAVLTVERAADVSKSLMDIAYAEQIKSGVLPESTLYTAIGHTAIPLKLRTIELNSRAELRKRQMEERRAKVELQRQLSENERIDMCRPRLFQGKTYETARSEVMKNKQYISQYIMDAIPSNNISNAQQELSAPLFIQQNHSVNESKYQNISPGSSDTLPIVPMCDENSRTSSSIQRIYLYTGGGKNRWWWQDKIPPALSNGSEIKNNTENEK